MRVPGGRARPLTEKGSPRGRKPPPAAVVRVGVDTGGTFTDLVAVVGREIRRHKVRSTPANPALAVRQGLAEMLDPGVAAHVSYGTTVATNTLLERRGARVTMVTNAGFEDVIEIGRQDRREIYALSPERTPPLVPRSRRLGIDERTLFDGTRLRTPKRTEISALVRRARATHPEAIAICLLHSYACSEPERTIADALATIGVPVTASHVVSPEYREVERFSTALVNAYVMPKLAAHLADLRAGEQVGELRVLESNGGAIGVERARQEPVRTVLSGPSAGVVGAAAIAARSGIDRFVTFDMGGTSTDVSLVERVPTRAATGEVGGHAVRVPLIDIHTVGAGGGSIARLDPGGALKVGPQSAGADPGPACYGRGLEPTVTDANLLLGRLVVDRFLSGRMRLDPRRAARAMTRIARGFHGDVVRAAEGVIAVVDAAMERAIRTITVERGVDPRELALVAFGGAGPLHAAALARALGIRKVFLPIDPGLVCAIGAAVAPWSRESATTLRLVDPGFADLRRRAGTLERRLAQELAREPGVRGRVAVESTLDVRYAGQAYEIGVPLTADYGARFHAAHRSAFGHAAPQAPVEVVTLRVRATAVEPYPLARMFAAPGRGRSRPIASVDARVDGKTRAVPVYERARLGRGALTGPAIVVELSATTWVPPDFVLRADRHGNLHLEAR